MVPLNFRDNTRNDQIYEGNAQSKQDQDAMKNLNSAVSIHNSCYQNQCINKYNDSEHLNRVLTKNCFALLFRQFSNLLCIGSAK